MARLRLAEAAQGNCGPASFGTPVVPAKAAVR